MAKSKKKLIAAIFFIVVPVLTVAPFVLFRSPTPDHFEHGIAVCEPEYNPAQTESWSFDEYRALLNGLLIESTNPDALVIASMLENRNDSNARLSSLEQLTSEWPESQLLNMHLLNECAGNSEHPYCQPDRVEEALAVNRDNAVAWSLAAIFRDIRGDSVGAESAMQSATSSPSFDDYFGHQIRVMRDHGPTESKYELIPFRFNIIAEATNLLLSNSHLLSNVCDTANPSRDQLSSTCVEFGERMYQQAQSTLMNFVGLSIAEIGARSAGNPDLEVHYQLLYEEIQENRNLPGSDTDLFNTVSSLMSYDADLNEYWIDSIIELGEEGAMKATVAEAKRLSGNPDYAPCVIR